MQLSDGEKLIIMMMCDLFKHLKVKSDVDPDFIQQTIWGDHLWGLRWQYSGIPFSKGETPNEVTETLNAMDMWSIIEQSYEKLSKADKERIKKEAHPFGDHVHFDGFDGNHESHGGIARYLIEQLDRFTYFKGRGLNSHMPSVDRYNRMYRLFEPMRNTLLGSGLLSASLIIDLLNAQRLPNP